MQTYKHTKTQAHKHTSIQTHKHTNSQTHKLTDIHIQTHKQTDWRRVIRVHNNNSPSIKNSLQELCCAVDI